MTVIKRKKVLFLITKSNWGGAQRYVYDLATNLDTMKFEPVVAMGGDGVLGTMLHNAGIRTITINSLERNISLKKEWQFAQELWDILKTERPDIFHVNSSKAGGVGTLLGRLARVPLVLFTAHGWAFNEDRPFWQKMIIKSLHYFTVLLSHRTIAVSNAIVSQMNWPGALRKMKVVHPGRTIGPMYNRDEARTKLIDFCPALGPFINDYWLVCIAELHPIKRHNVLIDAIAQVITNHPHTRLILIGDGTQTQVLQNQITALGLSAHVFLLGNIVEAARFLKAFDQFVLASKSESYGYVLHEAGAAGVPVVATNVGGIPDIITSPTEGLLVTPDSVEALMTAISATIADLEAARVRATTLQQKLSKRTVIHMTKQTESLYSI